MTYRERKEARLEKRRDWAESRDRKAAAGFAKADSIAQNIPLGQPILVGHHSEKRHRRDLARIDSGMRQGCESQSMAAEHRSKAAEIERQLDKSVYSDDPDAVEALEARIAEHEATRARMVLVNKLYRKGDAAGLAALGLDLEKLRAKVAGVGYSFVKAPYEPYQLSNLGGRITTDRKRLEAVKQRQARAEKASAAGGLLIEYLDGTDFATVDGVFQQVTQPRKWARVTFEEKPDRSVIDTLKAAGFRWGGGTWFGESKNLPALVVAS